MRVTKINISIEQAFYNLRRDRCVLIVAKDADGKVLVGAKPYFFPEGITRPVIRLLPNAAWPLWRGMEFLEAQNEDENE